MYTPKTAFKPQLNAIAPDFLGFLHRCAHVLELKTNAKFKSILANSIEWHRQTYKKCCQRRKILHNFQFDAVKISLRIVHLSLIKQWKERCANILHWIIAVISHETGLHVLHRSEGTTAKTLKGLHVLAVTNDNNDIEPESESKSPSTRAFFTFLPFVFAFALVVLRF